jgi:hypothetical protein
VIVFDGRRGTEERASAMLIFSTSTPVRAT